MTAQEMKALPRTEEGIFDLSGVVKEQNLKNEYEAAGKVYPVYAAFETTENKKEGYPDIMAQMRVWNKKVSGEFSMENASAYAAMLLGTIENISPEIYENYRELLDMFRGTVKKVLEQYYVAENDSFRGEAEDVQVFCDTVKQACDADLLLAEKYQMCVR